MTSLEKALTDALDRAWMEHERGDPAVAFDHLYRAVKLLAGLAIHQEARSLPLGLPQEPPEAPAPPLDPMSWESVAKRQKEAFKAQLQDIDLRLTQARIASSIGKKKDRTDFLLAEMARIEAVISEALKELMP